MIDYDVGDAVIKIGGRNNVGKVFKVKEIGPILPGNRTGRLSPSVRLYGLYAPLCDDWYFGLNFKKLPKASDEFTQQMRALKPSKRKQPA